MIFNSSKYNSHWQDKKLSDLGSFRRGKSRHRPRNDPKLFKNGVYPLVQTGEVKQASLYLNNHHSCYNEFGLSQSEIWPKNTLCITIAANIAETALLSYPMCFPDSVVGFNAYQEESSEIFMHYVFTYIRRAIQNSASGSIQDNINVDYLTGLKFKVPLKAYQDKIVSVLSVLDYKIDLNNRINAELEAMAKTLYDYWFVQFDFPDANGKPYKTSGGKMAYNAMLKREIPVGWNTSTLWNIAKYTNGLPMQKYREDSDTYLPVIKIREMNNGISADTERARVDIPEAAIINDGDVLFSWSATLDVKIWSQGKGALNQHIFKVSSDSYPKSFYYFELLNYLKHFKMIADLRKTTMGHITLDHLKQAYICLPPLFLLEEFHCKVENIFQQHLLLEKENRSLIKLRDWLLPILMNGQVKIK
ncbi:restriction endonuclease subunit S [Salmonella enterica]|nr:restriction endonuclease subunit S [Salmonella enterica subsp. arizonae serovar 63:z4,z32:-]ECG9617076.1 restriction endonuclease subunit S [Salmonella enterica]VEA48898.1 restriction endonuclease [Salmonella enterica subsp. arizonae]EFR3498720.1 restriction endonuclease subunit S [Salmonella enterica]EGJ1647855.1 restriction endonuclease subunit S [Salmonella enterica]